MLYNNILLIFYFFNIFQRGVVTMVIAIPPNVLNGFLWLASPFPVIWFVKRILDYAVFIQFSTFLKLNGNHFKLDFDWFYFL